MGRQEYRFALATQITRQLGSLGISQTTNDDGCDHKRIPDERCFGALDERKTCDTCAAQE